MHERMNSDEWVLRACVQDDLETLQSNIDTINMSVVLFHAVFYRRMRIVQWALANKANPNYRHPLMKATPLRAAAASCPDILRVLINAGAAIDTDCIAAILSSDFGENGAGDDRLFKTVQLYLKAGARFYHTRISVPRWVVQLERNRDEKHYNCIRAAAALYWCARRLGAPRDLMMHVIKHFIVPSSFDDAWLHRHESIKRRYY